MRLHYQDKNLIPGCGNGRTVSRAKRVSPQEACSVGWNGPDSTCSGCVQVLEPICRSEGTPDEK